jgi:hypothetical protein
MDTLEPIDPATLGPTTRVRQGETTGRVRWVLVVSLTLAIAAMAVAYLAS